MTTKCFVSELSGNTGGNRTTRRRTNSRSVKLRTGQLTDL